MLCWKTFRWIVMPIWPPKAFWPCKNKGVGWTQVGRHYERQRKIHWHFEIRIEEKALKKLWKFIWLNAEMKRIPRIHFHSKKPNQKKNLSSAFRHEWKIQDATPFKHCSSLCVKMLAFILLYCLLSTIANCTEPVDDPCGFVPCWTTDNYVNTHV